MPTVADNPLREGLRLAQTPDPLTIVIFGASGDLTKRKLMPALFNLARDRRLTGSVEIVGVARTRWSSDEFRAQMRDAVAAFGAGGAAAVPGAVWESFAGHLHYQTADLKSDEEYAALGKFLADLERERGLAANRLYYLAMPPSSYPEIIGRLGSSGLAREDGDHPGWKRVVVEKPFGRDLDSARTLNRTLLDIFDERQVYRIDHYLGKETVQNIQVFRFANAIFEPIWNRRYVDHVQITAAESLGVELRGGYYEEAGALRDMLQSHLLELVSLIAMEPVARISADEVRDEKVKVLRAIRPIRCGPGADIVRGQYGAGWVSGKRVPGYREEPDVSATSNTETFVAARLRIENWRWADVPFYVRSGKRLPQRVTEIAIQFKRAPHIPFGPRSSSADEAYGRAAAMDADEEPIPPNVLSLRIQPNEGISLRFAAKLPGRDVRIRPVNMDFRYGTVFGVQEGDAYQRLILDAMLGDPIRFARRDEVEAAWALVTPVLDAWSAAPPEKFPNYDAGTSGPAEADALLAADGRAWRRL